MTSDCILFIHILKKKKKCSDGQLNTFVCIVNVHILPNLFQ